jgi:hypothetical protein
MRQIDNEASYPEPIVDLTQGMEKKTTDLSFQNSPILRLMRQRQI